MFGLIQQINPIRINHPENIRVGSRRSFDRPPLLMHVSRAKRRKWFSRASRRGNLSRYYIIPAMRRGTKRRVRRGTMDGGEITGSRASKTASIKRKLTRLRLIYEIELRSRFASVNYSFASSGNNAICPRKSKSTRRWKMEAVKSPTRSSPRFL